MKILIVDPHVLFREGLQSLLAREPKISVMGLACTGEEAVVNAITFKPDVVLLEIGLIDGRGPDTIRELVDRLPGCKVVVLTSCEHKDQIVEAFAAGARGFLLKDRPAEELLRALQAVQEGQLALSRQMTVHLVDELYRLGRCPEPARIASEILTARETVVLRHVGNGASNAEIAVQLGISVHTVKVHVRNILEKLRLKRRHQLVDTARRYDGSSLPSHTPQAAVN